MHVFMNIIYMHYWLSSYCNWCCFTTLQLTEILGHCIPCYRNKRSTEHCRMMKQHKRACADVCTDCDVKGNNITKCHQQLQHDDDNAICKKIVDCYEKLGLPQCCLNLSNVQLECYASNPEKLKAQVAIGYMIPYTVMITGKNGFNYLYFKYSVSILYGMIVNLMINHKKRVL